MEGDIKEVKEMSVERLRAGEWDALVMGSEVPVLVEFEQTKSTLDNVYGFDRSEPEMVDPTMA